jgi:hypothetical protein
MTPTTPRGADEILLGFCRALRAAGVSVTQDRAHGYLAAVAELGLDDQRATYLAGRASLCAGPDDLERHDQARPCDRARRCAVLPGTSRGTAATSTPTAPCAAPCGGWESPVTSRGGAEPPVRDAWCC